MPRTVTQRPSSRLVLAPDARAAERELLAEVDAAQAGDPLARVIVVVPSHRLRLHVLSRLVEGGRARLGVEVLTLRALAGWILEASGNPRHPRDTDRGELLFPMLVERLAAGEPSLSGALQSFENGYAGVAAAVRDLLDAGFVESLLEVAGELMDSERPALGNDAVDRVRALARIAVRARAEIGELGLALDSDRLQQATERLAVRSAEGLPVALALIHGFSDATGVGSDLLERLFRSVPTIAILADPPPLDPSASASAAPWKFGARLRERFSGIARPERIGAHEDSRGTRVEPCFAAPDGDREVAAAVAALAGAVRCGARAERMALVARDLGPYLSALERTIDRHALPASGASGGEHPAARVARAWIELVDRRGEATIELVSNLVEARWRGASGRPAWELRVAAAEAGVRRLSELAERGSHGRERDPLSSVSRPARELVQALERLAKARTLGAFGGGLRVLLTAHPAGPEIDDRLVLPLEQLTSEPLASFGATSEESRRLLSGLWGEAGARPLGGDGAGVAILSVTEARGLALDRIAIVGMARERFPRRVRSDPFLPDALRLRLRTLLPDLPVKAEGHDEERFLFAQLLAAAPEIELSFPARDEGGHELARSTLLDELDRAGRLRAEKRIEVAATPAIDLAIRDSLSQECLGASFQWALTEADERFGSGPPSSAEPAARLAFHRALLRELAADPRDAARRESLGPYFGFVATRAAESDLRREPLSVTTLESLARCGWRTFLERLLKLSPPPVGADEIPSIPAHLVGLTVHQVLERLAPRPIVGGTVAEALARPPVPVSWPADDELEEWVAAAAADALRKECIDVVLFARPLALAAGEILEEVRALDWAGGARPLLAVEVQGSARLHLGSGRRELRFRADRCERQLPDESILLTDYKTGKPLSESKGLDSRRRALAKAVARGESLQLPAYVLAGGEHGLPFSGRLLYAKPGIALNARDARLESGDEIVARAPWEELYAAWDAGAFLPRLLEADLSKPWSGCDRCEVRVACVQGDSGARLRLARWMEAARSRTAAPDPNSGRHEAAERLFRLHDKAPPRSPASAAADEEPT